MRLQLIRSATLKLRYAGRTYLIDPWLAAKGSGRNYSGGGPSPLVDLPMTVEQIVGDVDTVIVSHLHSDHFDEAARAALPRDIPLLCATRDASAIVAFGFIDVEALDLTARVGAARIDVTSGRHGPPEVLAEMGEVAGFVFRAGGEPTLYWVGDSILCDEVRAALAEFRPDVVVVHACGAAWGRHAPLVMDEEMVREVLRLAPQATVVATHMDAVDHATVSRRALREFVDRAAGPDAGRLRIPEDGEILRFPG